MEKKYKISEFAAILGITAKTVYRMVEREEIMTVIEKVNNRPTTLVLATDEQIENFKHAYGKDMVNVGNYEDILTENNENVSDNNPTQYNKYTGSANDVIEKILQINQQYNERIQTLNEELIDSKSKLLLLEDKSQREGMYLNEIRELKTENEQLKTSKQNNFNLSLIVIVALLLVIIGMTTYIIVSNNTEAGIKNKNEQIEQPVKENIVNIDKKAAGQQKRK